MAVRGVLFDLGGTLLHYTPPGKTWEDMEKAGSLAIYQELLKQKWSLPAETDALETAWISIRKLWSSLDQYDPKDLRLENLMALVLGEWGFQNIPQDVLQRVGAAYMAAVQSFVYPLEGAEETLRALRNRGIRLGLISNTVWPGLSHRSDLDRYGLTPYLEHLIFSADEGVWKPHQEIFQHGLDALDLKPEDSVFVGDALYFDVWGAQQAGLRGVWIEHQNNWVPDGIQVTPDATIRKLPELLELVSAWSNHNG